MASVAELKEKHAAATASVNSLRERLRQRRETLLDTDVARYSKSQGRVPVSFNPTDLVCCRTLQGHSGKVVDFGLSPPFRHNFCDFSLSFRLLVCN
ncbi:GTP binding protein2 [Zea mays]|uniref:GTP binding protein2 n=1 Tax=Zea mays TaxID=4577 RepID=A0A1D6KYX1_MAIZE|nr:GTP binding protein2 [Zea mays]